MQATFWRPHDIYLKRGADTEFRQWADKLLVAKVVSIRRFQVSDALLLTFPD